MDFFDEDVYEQEGASDDEIHTDDLILSDDETVETS
jgi:hypothetical protein